jgi:hypothetical protein
LLAYFPFGYYRLNYDPKNWYLLANQLRINYTKIDALNRAKLIDDSFNLARAGLLDLSIFFDLIKYISDEKNSLPIETAIYSLDYIAKMISDNFTVYNIFKKFSINLFKNFYENEITSFWNQTNLRNM